MRSIIAIFFTVLLTASMAHAERSCDVKVCNKIKRFSISPWSHIKDKIGEECYHVQMPESEAQKGKELSSSSRWYQGSSINPTKRSVTYINDVGVCR